MISHQRRNGRNAERAHLATAGLRNSVATSFSSAPGAAVAGVVVVIIVAWLTPTAVRASERPAIPDAATTAYVEQPVPAPAPAATAAPPAPIIVSTPSASVASATSVGAPVLEPDVQVVRFQGPPGLHVQVLAPEPIPVPIGDGAGIITVGLRRGVGYRLRITGIIERPLAELFPVIEIVGHLHRPEAIAAGKYPIRIAFNQDDMDDAVDRGRLVTKVIYLEDPDQALPLKMAKDEVPVVTLNPIEPPLRVASALGRPMAIVRIGGRRPTDAEIRGGVAGDSGLDWAESIGAKPCPFLCQGGAHCPLPRGPIGIPSPPPGRPSLPRDEYLCDGGDRAVPASPNSNGRVTGVDPRDAIVRFDIGVKGATQPRVLPTNVVCVYAPRFAEVRVTSAANENIDIQTTKTDKTLAKSSQAESMAGSRRLVQNQAAELARERRRASGMKGRVVPGEASNAPVANAYWGDQMAILTVAKQTAEISRNRQKPGQVNKRLRLDGIKSAEGPVVAGVVEGASEAVKVWGPHAITGVEVPPDRPGLAVVKRVSATEAEPGETLTYAIVYRNMGNTPIKSVSIVDSLLPRLEYIVGTATGPAGTNFTTAVNRAGATELRWELPRVLAPGVSGYVSFQAIVR